VRKLLVVIALGNLGLLAGCGGGGGGSTPVGVPTTITLSPSVGQSIASGASLNISATVTTGSSNSSTVTWSLSGPGALSSSTANPVTYTAPASVTANTPVAVIATAGSGSSATSNYLPLTVLPSGATNTNTVPLVVDGGPAPPYPDGVFTSVNICAPGTNTCQTVDHVLVDTGSYGLRVLQSVLKSSLSLPDLVDSNNNPIFNCVAFLDGSYLWGPVAEADLRLNGEVAGQSLVQVISSSNSGIPTACSNGGTNENTPQLLAANGILGIGGEPTDCELAGVNFCDGSLGQIAPVYFSCPNSACGTGDLPITIPLNDQVVNPVVLFATDNNGDLLTMPALSNDAEPTASGTMTFGIGTKSNNALGSATILTLDTSDSFQTNFEGENLVFSFIDSGSNGLFFSNFVSNIPICTVNTRYFCPTSPLSLTATNTGTNNGVSTVGFTVDNADTLLNNNPNDEAFENLAGPQNSNPPAGCSGGQGDCTFDFGFPFFYGRTVFTAIDGQNTPSATAPWFAY